jgi:ferritin-like metal-binding protein YciE
LVPIIGSAPLAFRIEEYATELQSRKVDLESLLAKSAVEVRDHPDDAMLALIEETHKMAAICAPKVRDAALAASLQRIIHYKIAGYGTIASYAKALGHLDEAGHFAQLADRDKALDVEFTELAKATLNPDASRSLRIEPTPVTTH